MNTAVLLIKNIGTLQTPVGSDKHVGVRQRENLKLHNASILIVDGVIREIKSNGEEIVTSSCDVKIVDAKGKLVTPGLIDCHTHLVFGGWRQHEVPMKLSGLSYIDILKRGGGILDTVDKTRQATFDELYQKGLSILDSMLSLGVTSCEAKSGYGLDLATEVKQIEVIKELERDHVMTVVPTFLGAHAIPREFSGKAGEYIDIICNEMIPYVAKNKLAKYCDVFCEVAVFNADESRKILLCAKEHGLKLRIHTDEIESIGGAELAGEIPCESAEHLIASTKKGREALAKGGTIAVLLPQTSFYLGKGFAEARDMIDLGIPVAIATDFNPGSCPSFDLQFAMTLGYLKYRLFPEEILTAVTINAACAIGEEQRRGSIEVGKEADIVIWKAEDMEMLCYRFGENLADTVIKSGKIVKSNC